MPILSNVAQYGPPASSGTATLYQDLVLNADAATASLFLMVQALPSLCFWADCTAGAGTTTLLPEFCARGSTQVIGGQPEPLQIFLPLGPPVLIPAAGGGASLNNYTLPCTWIRMTLTRSPGIATTLRLYMAAGV